jgi:diguanylate cyclase (GGDEF)-like protein
MIEASTISFTKNGPALFSAEEVRHLMSVEFERARRHSYPITCMMMMVDRLFDLHTVHGFESKSTVMNGMVSLLKKETRTSDFLGCLIDDRLIALFPHTNAESARFLAKRILDGARTIEFGMGRQTIRITASIGLSHNLDRGAQSFETLLRVAEEGLTVADAGGGDRYVETELYQLYETQLNKGKGTPSALESIAGVEHPVPEPVSAPESAPQPEVVKVPPTAEEVSAAAARLSEEMIELAIVEAREQSEQELLTKEEAYKREIEILQRRLTKLSSTLDLTEEELDRVRQMKVGDDGIRSIYSDVQGLRGDDVDSKAKHELIRKIFEANLELQKRKTA